MIVNMLNNSILTLNFILGPVKRGNKRLTHDPKTSEC